MDLTQPSEASRRSRHPGSRGNASVVVLIAAIVIVGGVMYFFKIKREIIPDQVKAEMIQHIVELNEFIEKNPDLVVEADAKFHTILDNDTYKKYAVALHRKTVSAHKGVHQAACDQKDADREVLPWVAKYNRAKAGPGFDGAAARELLDEGSALLDRFGKTSHGAVLTEIRATLTTIASQPDEKIEKASRK